MSETVRVEIDGDLWMCIMQDDEKAGTVKLWLSDQQTRYPDKTVVLPRDWCTEWVGGDYEGLYVTGVRGGGVLAILLEYASEWAYLYRDADKGEFGND